VPDASCVCQGLLCSLLLIINRLFTVTRRSMTLALADRSSDENNMFQIRRVGTSASAHLTTQALFAIAIRRNLSNVSTSDFGCVVMDDVQRWAVRKGEVLAAAALTGSSWRFYKDMLEFWQKQAVTASSFQLAIHAIQSDATNSSIWRRQKLHTTRICSAYALDGAEPGPWDDNFCAISRYSDIQVVASGSAANTLAIIEKQMRALQCPTWDDMLVSLRLGVFGDTEDHYTTYLYESDAGRDEVAVRKHLEHKLSQVPSIFFVHGNCLLHQCAIIDLGEFALIDAYLLRAGKKYRYFATLAKLVNCWREQAQSMFSIWAATHGKADALMFAKSLPPRCIAGRWGSGSATEAWLEKLGQKKLVAVAEQCWASKLAASGTGLPQEQPIAKGPMAVDAIADQVDELNLEEQRQYRETMSRWKRDALAAIRDATFRVVLSAAHRARQPWDHLRKFLDRPYSKVELDEAGGALARLVTGRADKIMDEFTTLVSNSTYWQGLLSLAAEADWPWLWELMLSALLHNAGEFHRRIAVPVLRLR